MTEPDTAHGAEPEPSRESEADAPADSGEERDEQYAQTLSKLHRMSAPHTFADNLEETIRKRSAGRFFGRKAFGDRIPFELLAFVVIAVGLVMFFLLRSSQTGSLRYEKEPEPPTISPGARDVMPQPAPVDK